MQKTMSSSHRQTISFLTRKFREVGLEPDSRHGQNFLIDLNLIELLRRTAQLDRDDVVLEVGTGTGSLTAMLAEQAGAVISVEIDSHLHQLAREYLENYPNVTLLQLDALKNKNNFHPDVLQAVRDRMNERPGSRFKLAANLPYSCATPIMSNLLLTDVVPHSMTCTIQKELAERICAKPSTKDYSALSIWMQSLCDSEIVRVMAPTVFWPRPKVESAIIQIVFNPQKRAMISDLKFYHEFVRALFFHRRKFLRSVLINALKEQLTKAQIDEVILSLGYSSDARAEQFPVPEIIRLANAIQQKLGDVTSFAQRDSSVETSES
jgi:16S rRNA (adenine1518-N6/adenine1519-N6)-dimethyltransferase